MQSVDQTKMSAFLSYLAIGIEQSDDMLPESVVNFLLAEKMVQREFPPYLTVAPGAWDWYFDKVLWTIPQDIFKGKWLTKLSVIHMDGLTWVYYRDKPIFVMPAIRSGFIQVQLHGPTAGFIRSHTAIADLTPVYEGFNLTIVRNVDGNYVREVTVFNNMGNVKFRKLYGKKKI